MGMSIGFSLSHRLSHFIQVIMPSIQWSLVDAFKSGQAGPPVYVPPTFEEEVFEPRLKLERRTIADFETMGHIGRMKSVDEANKIFRFAYTRGHDNNDKEKGYFKIPLLRYMYVDVDKIKIRISRAEYLLATAVLQAVGEMERIARAVPYYALYKTVTLHLKKHFGVGLDKVVLVSIDRGGRIPCLLLQTALGLPFMETLKVDQGGGRLDEDKIRQFEEQGMFRDKHILFVDSTVDSGRQIRVLEQYFNNKEWKARLAHKSWSIVGSNERAENLTHHFNVNWGVDPDSTFEDNPELMGVDYARGDYTKVVEVPSEASIAIRKCLLSVPDGVIYDADDIAEQINTQIQQWHKHQAERRAKHKVSIATAKMEYKREVKALHKEKTEQKVRDEVEREWRLITNTKRWKDTVAQASTVSFEHLPASIPNGVPHSLHNILVIGNGRNVDLSVEATDLIADTLGPYHSFLAGTPNGNPGTVLKTVLSRIAQPEVRLYQPGYQEGKVDNSFGGVPVVFKGQEKSEMREQMVRDSHIAFVLGGAEGTLRETLLALKLGKPSVMVSGWGPIPRYFLQSKKYAKLSHLRVCDNIVEAMQTIMDMTKM